MSSNKNKASKAVVKKVTSKAVNSSQSSRSLDYLGSQGLTHDEVQNMLSMLTPSINVEIENQLN